MLTLEFIIMPDIKENHNSKRIM